MGRLCAGVDVLFHQAAIRITQCAEDPALAVDVLVNGAFSVFDAAVRAGVGRVVAASSASVYGPADRFPTGELHHHYHNRTLYGAAKAFNEGLLRSFHDMYGLSYVALRYFNVYGPRMDTHGMYTEVLIRWIERIEAGAPPVIHGAGTETMDFVYVKDVARANLLAALSSSTDHVFNIGTGTETSLDALARALLDVMGSRLEPEYAPPRRFNSVPRRVADIELARRLLGFEPVFALEQGLRDLVGWWRTTRAAPPRSMPPRAAAPQSANRTMNL
jgi:UDP-glucose 4-epimerase